MEQRDLQSAFRHDSQNSMELIHKNSCYLCKKQNQEKYSAHDQIFVKGGPGESCYLHPAKHLGDWNLPAEVHLQRPSLPKRTATYQQGLFSHVQNLLSS